MDRIGAMSVNQSLKTELSLPLVANITGDLDARMMLWDSCAGTTIALTTS
jgi:hypothetical protein